jgi:hypothetical protein
MNDEPLSPKWAKMIYVCTRDIKDERGANLPEGTVFTKSPDYAAEVLERPEVTGAVLVQPGASPNDLHIETFISILKRKAAIHEQGSSPVVIGINFARR